MKFIMCKYIKMIILILFIINVMTNTALSLPKPMNTEELFQNSNLFVKVKILSVNGNSAIATYTIAGDVASHALHYLNEDNQNQIKICWPELGMMGSWSVSFREGEEVQVYLKWLGEKGSREDISEKYADFENCYVATAWNAKVHSENTVINEEQSTTKNMLNDASTFLS